MAESAAGSGAESAGTSSKGAPSAKPCPYAVPEHTLIRCIGQGSYGEVWLARNSFGTCRAVKIIACPSAERQRWADRELAGLKRFEPVSRSHAGLVDILQVGREAAGEYFYYVMELGDDAATGQEIRPEQYEPKTLASDILQSGRLPIQQCLKLGLSLSGAMAHLHQHGLLHRDIKPSNIIFVNEVPKLADIGLVAAVAEAHSYVGTTGFIPPEGPVSPQADIYALGKVLYEMSTGNDRNDFPALPPDLHTFADVEEFHEFNEIVLRACQDDPKRRYASATDLEADLQVLAVGKSVKRLRRLERQVALFKRVAIGAAVVGLVGGGLFYEWQRERAHAAEQRQRQVGSLLAEGTYALNGGDLLQSLPSFVEALRLEADNPAAVAAHRLRLGTLLDQCPTLTHVWFAKRDISQACFSPNGKWGLLAVLWGQVQVWDLATGEARSPPFGSAHLETAHFSPDGQRVVTAGQDTAATVWKLPAGEALLRLPHPHFARHAQFSPDGKWIATACADGAARIWKAATAELVRTLPAHSNVVFQVAFSPDGQWLATASRDQNACLWETATGARHGPVLRHGSWVYHAA